MQTLSILGATGSIGQSTLRVIRQHREQFNIFALTGQTRLKQLAQDTHEFQPSVVVVPLGRKDQFKEALNKLKASWTGEVMEGVDALNKVASDASVTTVMSAIVGSAGLAPTLSAIQAGKKILLANKESLVMAGKLMMQAAKQSDAQILPVDSEHNAIFQAFPQIMSFEDRKKLHHIILTASGGPFRTWSATQIRQDATPAAACKHPNWSMGEKISVDSASLMNKGLELIEAAFLFGLPEHQIKVVVHPQSIIHSMVQFCDGSVIAQLGTPDMSIPIAYTLAWPERISMDVPFLDWKQLSALTFEEPDLVRFPCLKLARDSLKAGESATVVLNASNEVAVEAFLQGKIDFMQISEVVEKTLTKYPMTMQSSIGTILQTDDEARHIARDFITKIIAGFRSRNN